MITVESYTNNVKIGESGRIIFRAVSPVGRKIIWLNADLLGDSNPGFWINTDDGSNVAGLRYFPTKVGTFDLHVFATDILGCMGSTGLRRDVKVVQ